MKSLLIILAILTSLAYAEWQIETVDNCGGWTSLKLDSTNNPHISYASADLHSLKYAYLDNSVFLVYTVIEHPGSSMGISHTSLALDSYEDPHITCNEYSFGYPGWLRYEYWDGSEWQTGAQLPWPNNNSYAPSLQLDSSDYPCLSYYCMHGYLGYASWDGADWQCEEVDSTLHPWSTLSLKLDSFQHPHISYSDHYEDRDFLYAFWDGGAWQIETIDSVGSVGEYPSLDLDSSGYPHISYFDDTNDDLKYAYWDGSVWHLEVVDSSGSVGQYTSLDLDSSGYPHISYFDDTNDNLKYAYWDGSVWNLEVVDALGSVGQYTSMELDLTDLAHISYMDAGNYNLKYAYRYDTGIESPCNVEGCYLLPLSPNPSSSMFTVEFTLQENAIVVLYIYDVSGRMITESPATTYSSGLHQIHFSDLKNGVYLCRMTSGDFTATQQFVVIE